MSATVTWIRAEYEESTVDGITGVKVCEEAGITYRQLDYWARTGLAEPSIRPAKGSGSQRLYSPADVELLRRVKRLLDAGISLPTIRAAVTDGAIPDVLRLPGGVVVLLAKDSTNEDEPTSATSL